jgi:hypothetical protein
VLVEVVRPVLRKHGRVLLVPHVEEEEEWQDVRLPVRPVDRATNAEAIIETAGLLVAGSPSHAKAILQAKLTTTPGAVHLIANATLLAGKTSKSVTFNWEWSLDVKSWNTLPSTPLADTIVPNLTLMTSYQFRVSVTVARKTGSFSQPVGLLVQ